MRIKIFSILICLPIYIFGQIDWKVDIGVDYPFIETKKVFVESGNLDIGYGKLNYYPEIEILGGIYLQNNLSIQFGLEYNHIQIEYGYKFYSKYEKEILIDATDFLKSYDYLGYKVHFSYDICKKIQISAVANLLNLLTPMKHAIEDKSRISLRKYQSSTNQECYNIFHDNYFSSFYIAGEFNILYKIWDDWSILLGYEHNLSNIAFTSSIIDISSNNKLYSSKLKDQVPTVNIGLYKSIF